MARAKRPAATRIGDGGHSWLGLSVSSSSLLLSSLELSDTKVYQPQVRALLGTGHFVRLAGGVSNTNNR